jgi:hypothetical protein
MAEIRHFKGWLVLMIAFGTTARGGDPDPKGVAFFEKRIRPILIERCYSCHSTDAKKLRGGLYLDTKGGWAKGGDNGPALVPGDAEASLMIQAVRYTEPTLQMPPKGKLPAEEIAALTDWVKMGAPDPRTGAAAAGKKLVDIEAGRKHWAFEPLHPAEPPEACDAAWCRTPIDRFILAKLERKGISPSPDADRRTLLRRAYFDLVGLPPSPEDVHAFLTDRGADAYDRLIDRLLDSPRYGERWARHWLDLARFAESHGFEHDYDRPSAYHYRDFVIEALNRDLPYDTFVKWQIAGDELAATDNLALKATGFLAAGVHSTQITANQVEKERYDELDDMANTIGTSMLGLTIGCARCHDHKFDPIPQRDYYRFLATFTTTVRTEVDLDLDPKGYCEEKAVYDPAHAQVVDALHAHETAELAAREQAIETMRGPAPDGSALRPEIGHILNKPASERNALEQAALATWLRVTDPRWRELQKAVLDHERIAPKPRTVKALISSEGLPAVRLHTQGADFLPKTHFLARGDPNQKQDEASPGFLQVLTTAPDAETRWRLDPPPGWRTSYRRTALANWLTDTQSGAGQLLARVIVNRLWQHHMGQGIVATASDFGKQGEPPSHPELLDWLASELIQGRWRLKPIHKLIMTSAVYRQASHSDVSKESADVDNILLWRFNRRRLEGEAIRDAMLALGERLDGRMFGPGSLEEDQPRRSIYFTIKRSKLIPMMGLFDAPDALQGVAVRPVTTVAPQSLLVMNSPMIRTWAQGFARRVLKSNDSPEAIVRSAYEIALARPPRQDELADGAAFLNAQAETYRAAKQSDPDERAATDFCQILMGLNESIYIE